MSDLFLFLLEGDAGNILSRLGTAARSPSIRPTRRKGQMRANGKKSRGKGRTESTFVNWEGSGTNPVAAQSDRQRRCAAPREAAAGGAAAQRTAHSAQHTAHAARTPTRHAHAPRSAQPSRAFGARRSRPGALAGAGLHSAPPLPPPAPPSLPIFWLKSPLSRFSLRAGCAAGERRGGTGRRRRPEGAELGARRAARASLRPRGSSEKAPTGRRRALRPPAWLCALPAGGRNRSGRRGGRRESRSGR